MLDHVFQTNFRIGQMLEAPDGQNSTEYCVASIADIKGENLLIKLNGYDNRKSYWCHFTSTDIHPVGWCEAQGMYLVPIQCTYIYTEFKSDFM